MEIFGNLAIYLRKWVSECFAGIYGGQTLLFLWDNCFMHGWSKKIFYKIGLVSTLPFKMFGPFWSVWCKMALAEVGVSLP